MITLLVALTCISAALLLCLFGWSLGVVGQLPAGGTDPVGNMVLAWWLTVAWLDAWIVRAADPHNYPEDI